MLWRIPGSEWVKGKQGGNRAGMRALVTSGPPPGLLAYEGDRAVGWCALSPRPVYGRLLRSRMLTGDKEEPGVWSIPCFYVSRDRRRSGVAAMLLAAAVSYAAEHGAACLEAYPIPSGGRRVMAADAYPGTVEMFAAAGFREVASGSKRRRVMRRDLGEHG